MLVLILHNKPKNYVNSTDPLTSLEILSYSPARSCFSRQRRSKDELVHLPALRTNKTKLKNLDTLDITENIAISAP